MAKEKKKIRPMSQSSIVNRKSSIYILHGWTYSISKWAPFVSLLKKRGLTPILVNIPGLTEKINKPWNIEDYSDWLYKKLEKDPALAGQEKVILLGHSNGGRIAMAFTIAHPQKVRKLVLIDSAGIYHNDIFIRTKKSVFFILAKIGRKVIPLDGARRLLYFLTGEKDYKTANPIMKKTMINLIQSDKFLLIENVKVPTIIIWGENDNITPLSNAQAISGQIKNSKLYVIDGAKHAPQFTHTEEVVNKIFEET